MEPQERKGRTAAQEMRDRIAALIAAQGLRPGDRIPTEAALQARFGGSRPMLREALKLLEQEGLLTVAHGRGRFVSAAGALDVQRPITRFESITEMGAALGLRYDNRVLSVAEERPGWETATALDLARGETVIRLERLRLHGKEPLIYSLAFVRRSAIPERLYEIDWSGSLLDLLDRHGMRPRMSAATVRARMLPDDVVARAGLDDFGPALVIEETAFTPAGLPVLRAADYHRAGRFAFDFARK